MVHGGDLKGITPLITPPPFPVSERQKGRWFTWGVGGGRWNLKSMTLLTKRPPPPPPLSLFQRGRGSGGSRRGPEGHNTSDKMLPPPPASPLPPPSLFQRDRRGGGSRRGPKEHDTSDNPSPPFPCFREAEAAVVHGGHLKGITPLIKCSPHPPPPLPFPVSERQKGRWFTAGT